MKKNELKQLVALYVPENNTLSLAKLSLLNVVIIDLCLLGFCFLLSKLFKKTLFTLVEDIAWWLFITLIPQIVTSFFVFSEMGRIINSLQTITRDLDKLGLEEDADLPDQTLDLLKNIVSYANDVGLIDTYPNFVKTLKIIHAKIYVNETLNWVQSKTIPMIDHCGSAEINSQPSLFQIVRLPEAPLRILCRYVDAEQQRTKTLNDPKQKMVSLRSCSRRLFDASVSRNAWIHALVNHGIRGEQNSVEALLQKHGDLAKQNGLITDYSGRFMICTAYQRARWDGDWHMWQMMERYMQSNEIIEQRTALERSGLGEAGKYGSVFDFRPILDLYKKFIDQLKVNSDLDELINQWKSIYQEQAKLPAHVIHQWFHPKRSCYSNLKDPKFDEPELPRNTQVTNFGNIFERRKNDKFGVHYGIIRGHLPETEIKGDDSIHFALRYNDSYKKFMANIKIDFRILTALSKKISQELSQPLNEELSSSMSSVSISRN